MLNLYFNCKISFTKNKNNSIQESAFYPVIYPSSYVKKLKYSQYEVLINTILSYSKIEFEKVIFNIEFDKDDIKKEKELEKIIKENINCKYLEIKNKRPSTISGWIDDINKYESYFGSSSPVIVVLNHDHPFVDHSDIVLKKIISEIFNSNENNDFKVMYYSHTPEVVSWALNGRVGNLYEIKNNFIYESKSVDKWLDGYCVMNLNTLKYIFQSAITSNKYIARYDWPGVKYKSLNLKTYVYPREFFKHYDGYGHVTGIRLLSNNIEKIEVNLEECKINSYDAEELIDYYYQKWIDCFILSIRDYMYNNSYSINKNNHKYRKILDQTFQIFEVTYIKHDLNNNLILVDDVEYICDGLKNKIYYNANSLYILISIDNKLRNNSLISKLRSQKIVNNLFVKVKFICRKFLKFSFN